MFGSNTILASKDLKRGRFTETKVVAMFINTVALRLILTIFLHHISFLKSQFKH